MSMLLGCIADDFTGATDLANTLVRQGMSAVVLLGVPSAGTALPDADAAVIALKSRSITAADAVSMSLAALDWLQRAGGPGTQYYFKYCSTFDSTDAGNIGPVAEALLAALGEEFTVACPAFPANGRTIYKGNLYVGDVLLSESGMRHHPLTPMTDAFLPRVLQRQSRGRVGLIPFEVVAKGADAIRDAIETLRAGGTRMAIVDALTDDHLLAIGRACAGLKLLTGGSGLALGLPQNFRVQKRLASHAAAALPQPGGLAAVLSGSCSAATRRQVREMQKHGAAYELDALACVDDMVSAALAWARPRLGQQPLLIYSTAEPAVVEEVQKQLGREQSGTRIEQAMGAIARELVALGVRRMVIAGGETSGAVVTALGISGLRVGAEIDPGVPWTASLSEPHIALALKSGNFGSDDFFLKAFEKLAAEPALR